MMELTNQVGNKIFMDSLREHISESMINAAEPTIQKALADIEKTMRNRVSEICVGMVAGEIDIFRQSDRLCITIKDHGK